MCFAQSCPVEAFQHVPRIQPLTLTETLHILCKQLRQLPRPFEVFKKRNFCSICDIKGRLVVFQCATPALRGFGIVLRYGRPKVRHEAAPILKCRALNKRYGDGTVRNVLRFWLAQKTARHCHASDRFEAHNWYVGRGGYVDKRDWVIVGGNVGENVEVEQPA